MQGQWSGQWSGSWEGGTDEAGNPVAVAGLQVAGVGAAVLAVRRTVSAALVAGGVASEVLWAEVDAQAAPVDIRVSWVEVDTQAAPVDVRVSWLEMDTAASSDGPVIKPPVYVPGSAGGRMVRDFDIARRPKPGKTRKQRNNEALLLAVLM